MYAFSMELFAVEPHVIVYYLVNLTTGNIHHFAFPDRAKDLSEKV